MSFSFQDSTARTAWGNATTQTGQLAAFRALWSGDVSVRYYTSGGTPLGTATHSGWDAIDTSTTPYSVTLAGRPAAWSHLADGTAAYCIVAVPGGADIIRADVTLAKVVNASNGIVNLDNAAGAAGLRINASAGLPVSALPSWLGAVDEWSAISSSSLTASGAGWSGAEPGPLANGTYVDIVSAWGGGVLNTVGVWRGGSFVAGTFLVIFGGGHGNYGGNEVMAYGPLESDAPTWSRITDPTIPAAVDVGRIDGYPVSRHTYDTLVFLPDQNKMLCIGAPGHHNVGSNFNQGDVFDFAQNPATGNPWATADTDFPAFNGGGVGAINLLSGYDSATGKAWGIGKGNGQRIGAYTAISGAWTSSAIDNQDAPSSGKAGLSPSLSILAFCTDAGAVRAVDLRSTPAIYTPSITGTGPGSDCSLEWDSVGGRFIAWAGSGKTLYFLTPSGTPYSGGAAWVWTSFTPSGGATPADETTNGTYGRFRLAESLAGARGLLLMPTESASLCFYRLS